MSNVHRLKTSEKIFFITTNLNLGEPSFHEPEYQIIAKTIVTERRRLDFLLFGYVLMPDHWHALIWPRAPVTISDVLQNVMVIRIHPSQGVRGFLVVIEHIVSAEKGIIVQGQPSAADAQITVAASVLGSLCPPCQGIQKAAGAHAHEPGPEGFGREARKVAVVQLQQLFPRPSVVAACPIQIDYVHLPDDYHA